MLKAVARSRKLSAVAEKSGRLRSERPSVIPSRSLGSSVPFCNPGSIVAREPAIPPSPPITDQKSFNALFHNADVIAVSWFPRSERLHEFDPLPIVGSSEFNPHTREVVVNEFTRFVTISGSHRDPIVCRSVLVLRGITASAIGSITPPSELIFNG